MQQWLFGTKKVADAAPEQRFGGLAASNLSHEFGTRESHPAQGKGRAIFLVTRNGYW